MKRETKIPLRESLSQLKPKLNQELGEEKPEEVSEIMEDSHVQQDPPAEGPEARDPANPYTEKDRGEPDLEPEDEQEAWVELVRKGKESADEELRETAKTSPPEEPGEPRLRDDQGS